MTDNGYIKLYRQITRWEWYSNINTFRLFLHILLTANFTSGKFEGKTIRRGQLVTSLPKLSHATTLTIQQVRTALSNLKSTGEITDKSFSKYRIITVLNYDLYQDNNRVDNSILTESQQSNNSQITGKQQANNRQVTGKQQQYKNNKNNKKERREEILSLTGERTSAPRFVPPALEDVQSFCQENGIQVDAEKFIAYYESNGWRVGRNPMKNWQAACRNWSRRDRQQPAPTTAATVAQGYHQRDYSSEQEAAFLRMMEMEEEP